MVDDVLRCGLTTGGIGSMMGPMFDSYHDSDDRDDRDDGDDGRAPICPSCGVTALPAHLSNVIDTSFVCDNEGCDAYGDAVS